MEQVLRILFCHIGELDLIVSSEERNLLPGAQDLAFALDKDDAPSNLS